MGCSTAIWVVVFLCMSYYHLPSFSLAIVVLSLIILLLVCTVIVARHLRPLDKLARQVQRVTEGHLDEQMPTATRRRDSVGQLQNGFIQMQQALHTHVSEIQQVNAALEQQNQELVEASKIQQEADNRKTAFVQDMLHQIRTPLNIINGFTQVLAAEYHNIPEEDITIGCRQKDDENVEITVSDTGLGISLDKHDNIFSQFTKLNAFSEGIGLGLSICQNTIHMLGGEIVLDENDSSGTRFIITLPIHHN